MAVALRWRRDESGGAGGDAASLRPAPLSDPCSDHVDTCISQSASMVQSGADICANRGQVQTNKKGNWYTKRLWSVRQSVRAVCSAMAQLAVGDTRLPVRQWTERSSEVRAPRAAFRPPRRGPCAPETCPCAGWASIPSWEQRARSGRVGAAAQVRCVSLEVMYERCGVHGAARCGDAAAPEGGAAKRAVRGASHTGSGGTGEWGFCGALQLELVGARCAAPAALLRCESQFPSDGRACANANERAARGSQRNGTGAGVRAGAAVAGRWQKVQQLGWVGVRRRVGHVQLRGCVCVWAWRGGVARLKSACRTRAVAAVEAASSPPATSAGQPTVCVCAPHSPAHFAGCAAREAGAGSGARERREPARDATWAAVDHRILVCVRPPGWRRARLGAKEMRVAAQPQVCGRGVTSG